MYLEVLFVPASGAEPTKYGVNLETNMTYAALRESVSALTQVRCVRCADALAVPQGRGNRLCTAYTSRAHRMQNLPVRHPLYPGAVDAHCLVRGAAVADHVLLHRRPALGAARARLDARVLRGRAGREGGQERGMAHYASSGKNAVVCVCVCFGGKGERAPQLLMWVLTFATIMLKVLSSQPPLKLGTALQ